MSSAGVWEYDFSCGHHLEPAGSLLWVPKSTFYHISEATPFGVQNVDFGQAETTSASLHYSNK